MHPAIIRSSLIVLSGKYSTRIILALVILGRAVQLFYYYNVMVDGMFQAMAMENFVAGHGFSLGEAAVSDLATVNYTLLNNWPPGYSLLLSPFYILTGQNYIAAGLITEFIFAILLIVYSRKLLKLLGTPLWLINAFTLLTGTYLYWFYKICSSDASAITFMLMGLYYTLILINTKKAGWKTYAGILLPLAAAGLIKYMFIPVLFVIPAYLFIAGRQDKTLRKVSVISGLILAVFFSLLLWWLSSSTGSFAYISSPERGFYPEHLLEAWPVVPASVLSPDTAGKLFNQPTETNSVITGLYRYFSFAGLCLMTGLLAWQLAKPTDNRIHHFLKLSGLLVLSLNIELAVLSLFIGKEEIIQGVKWTYIQEPRYYGLANVLIQLSIFSLLLLKSRRLYLFSVILILGMIPDMFRGQLLIAKRLIHRKTETYHWQTELAIQRYADRLIRDIKKEYGDSPIIIGGTSYYVNYRISLFSHIPVLNNLRLLTEKEIQPANKKAILILAVEQSKKEILSGISDQWKIQFAGEQKGFYFYQVHAKKRE